MSIWMPALLLSANASAAFSTNTDMAPQAMKGVCITLITEVTGDMDDVGWAVVGLQVKVWRRGDYLTWAMDMLHTIASCNNPRSWLAIRLT
jgi:hypothetical protein